MNTLAFRWGSSSGRAYLVLIHTSAAPDGEEWEAYLKCVAKTLSEATARVHAFVATDGGAPSAPQRRALAAAFLGGDALTHVFTSDAFIRGVVTAFRWISRDGAVAHHPNDFDVVCGECGLSPRDVLANFREVQKELPQVRTLQHLVEGSRYSADRVG